MSREKLLFVLVVGVWLSVASSGTASAACTAVDTSRGPLDAARVAARNETITGEIDASGCDIGVYIPIGVKNVTVSATIHDADQFGVFNNGHAKVSGSEIYNIGHHDASGAFDPNGSQTGVGVYFFDASGSVGDNDIHDYQKGGVVVNGLSSANVTNNTIAGFTPIPFIAQNGIQFGYGARGNAMGNAVTGNWYVGANWTSTGILLFETGNVTVQGNTVQDNQSGITIEAWCWFEPSADNNHVVNNTVLGADFGVAIGAYSVGGYSSCDASADNNKVTNNLIDATPGVGDTGIFLGAGVFGGLDSPSADNNKLIHNTVKGYGTAIDASGTSSKVHANVIEP